MANFLKVKSTNEFGNPVEAIINIDNIDMILTENKIVTFNGSDRYICLDDESYRILLIEIGKF